LTATYAAGWGNVSPRPSRFKPGFLSRTVAGIRTLTLARLLPEKTVKNLLVGRLTRLISLSAAERAGWLEAIHAVSRRSVSGNACEMRGATVTSP
jgi:hypothetical protein